MHAVSSIHIENASVSAIIHNERFFSVDYAIDTEEKNEYLTLANTAQMMRKARLDFELTPRTSINGKTIFRKLPKNTELVKEAIVNLNERHTMENLKLISIHLEKMGFKVCHLAIHKDEGHIEADGKKVFNYHAHILMVNYDFENHRTIRPSPGQMRKLQSDVASLLEMERGKQYINPEKASGERLVEYQKNPQNFTFEKKKRLGIWEYKRMMKEQSENFQDMESENIKLKKALAAAVVILDKSATPAKAHQAIKKIRAKVDQTKLNEMLEMWKDVESVNYDFRNTQKQITALQSLEMEQKKELHRLNTEINKIKKDDELKLLKIKELENKLLKITEAEQDARNTISTYKDTPKSIETALQRQISDLEIRLSNMPKKELVDDIKAENLSLAEDLKTMDKLYGQLEGLIEEGATNEELQAYIKRHERYKPKRSNYLTAKERAQNSYRQGIGKPPILVSHEKPESVITTLDEIKEMFEKGKNEDEETPSKRPGKS